MSAAPSRSHGSPPGPHGSTIDSLGSGRRRLLGIVCALAVAWSLALLLMDLRTAKPRIVSPGQLLKAHVVVVARRLGGNSDRIRVERVLRGEIPAESELRVINLADVPNLSTDQPYLVALSHFRQDYEVTTLEGQRVAPLVYPATPEIIEQAKSILR